MSATETDAGRLRAQLDRKLAETTMAMLLAGDPDDETHRWNAALRKALRGLADAVAPMLRTLDDYGAEIIAVDNSGWEINDWHPEAPDGVEVHRDIAEAYRRAVAALAWPDGETTP